MATKNTTSSTSRRRATGAGAVYRRWGIRALLALVVGVGLGAAGGVMTVSRLEPGRADSVDSLAVMLDSISRGRIPQASSSRSSAPAPPPAEPPAPVETLVSVPTVVDLEEGDARNAILDAGLQVGEVQFRPSVKPAGMVLATFPVSGARVPTQSAVTLVLSDGRDPADTLRF